MIHTAPSFFRLARDASLLSSHDRSKVGAVLVNKRPVVFGFNKFKSHTKYANPEIHTKISVHAEIDCIIEVKDKDLKGWSIYVYREDCHGNVANSRPCEQCLTELKIRGIRKIYYTTKKFPYWNMEYI